MITRSIILVSAAISGLAFGGDPVSAKAPVVTEEDWSFCDIYDLLGTPLYKNPENPLIQSFKFYGCAQVQYAYIDGEGVDGVDFDEDFDEIRRLRFGTEIKFLNYFKLKGNANLVRDNTPSGGSRSFRYTTLDDARLYFDAKKAFGIDALDSLVFSYGRHKILVGEEVHVSSKKIKTVERSALANTLFPTRTTGLSADASKGNWSGTAAIFSTAPSREFADWDQGEMFYLNSIFTLANKDEIVVDFLYNDANGEVSNFITDFQSRPLYKWATSVAYRGKRDRFEFMANAAVGDGGDRQTADQGGMFWGLVLMPSYWVVDDKVELVGRYAYLAGEEDRGIRTNSRYFRRAHGGDVNGGRGDEHHSIYAGLNWYLCGHKSKIMTGLEWETLDTNRGDADAATLWLAYRTYF